MLEVQALYSGPAVEKAARVTIIDTTNTARLTAYITNNTGKLSRPLRAHWRSMAEFITPTEAKRAIRVGSVPLEWRKEFEQAIADFVRNDLTRIQTTVFAEVGSLIARRINALPRKDFAFSATKRRIVERIETHGGELITRMTEAQLAAARAALLQYVVTEALTPFELAKRLRYFIGLTEGYSRAVLRLERELISQGLAKDLVAKQISRYADFLHKVRAENIARTELSFGYNHGQLEAIRQAREDGWILGDIFKIWSTTGQEGRVCEECDALDGETVRENEFFSAGVEAPPLHPSCGCSLSYEMRR